MWKINILLVCLITQIVISPGPARGYPTPGEAGYIGSERCCSCHEATHPELVKEWRASAHRLAMIPALSNNAVSANVKMPVSFERGDILAVIGREDGKYVLIGSGFQVFPVESFSLDNPFPPHDRIGFDREKLDASESCLGCHATGYFLSAKKYAEPGVACEACHGAGKKHAEAGGSAGTIVNPARLPHERRLMVCGQCHSCGKDTSGKHPFPVVNGVGPFTPGDNLASAFVDDRPIADTRGGEYSTFINAPEPYSSQNCTDCHDPHGKAGNPSLLVRSTSALCLRCHGNPLSGIVQVGPERHWGADKHNCWFCHKYTHTH